MTSSLVQLIAKGESAILELKRSTGELREAMQTLCAFANGKGGRVITGVKPNGDLIGQQVSEQTLHEIAATRERLEPPLDADVETVDVAPGRGALVLSVAGVSDSVPFTFDGRAFERVGLKDVDRDEVFRIVGIIQSIGRLAGPVGKSLPDVLDRLGLRKGGKLLRAVVVLFGKTFLPDYPQCELRMARFRGVESTGEVTPQVEALLRLLAERDALSNAEIRAELKLKDRVHVQHSYIAPALDRGLVEMTIPDKPQSRLQKYRLTESGRAVLAKEKSSR